MAQLSAMGFPEVRCQKALLATGNSDPEAAMEWLFAHMEDPGTCPQYFQMSIPFLSADVFAATRNQSCMACYELRDTSQEASD